LSEVICFNKGNIATGKNGRGNIREDNGVDNIEEAFVMSASSFLFDHFT